MPDIDHGTYDPFSLSDEALRAYLDGEHGPPSDEAVRIVQAELEYEARRIDRPTRPGKPAGDADA